MIGAAFAFGVPLIWTVTRPPTSVGDVVEAENRIETSTSSTPPPTTLPASGAPPTTAAPIPTFTVSDPVPSDPVDRATPVGLRIDAIDVAAEVAPYGVAANGDMAVPTNVREVAWYEFGPRPGDAGSAVLAAHVDLASQGAGVFFDLEDLLPGDVVIVTYSDGSERNFEVAARHRYHKEELPLDVIFAEEGPPVLTLITCGGGFNRSLLQYDSNVVVYAFPVDGDIR